MPVRLLLLLSFNYTVNNSSFPLASVYQFALRLKLFFSTAICYQIILFFLLYLQTLTYNPYFQNFAVVSLLMKAFSHPDNCHVGSHTIGDARCTTFRQRLYNQTGNGLADFSLDQSYASQLRSRCPRSGGDQNLFFLDFVTPTKFDNSYFKNLLASKGLLNSDQVLVTKSQQSMELVKQYAENMELFFQQFAKSMVKMGNISPLTGSWGEIRKNCRKINS